MRSSSTSSRGGPSPTAILPAARAAIDRYTGELLPDDRYEDWAGERRELLHLRHLNLLRIAGDWMAVSELDPSDERAHVEVMREQTARGDYGGALLQYSRLERVLDRDLGVTPGPAARALRDQIDAELASTRVGPTEFSGTSSSSLQDLLAELAALARRQKALLDAARRRTRAPPVYGIGVVSPEDLAAVDRSWTELRHRKGEIVERLEVIFSIDDPCDTAAVRAKWLVDAVDELVGLLERAEPARCIGTQAGHQLACRLHRPGLQRRGAGMDAAPLAACAPRGQTRPRGRGSTPGCCSPTSLPKRRCRRSQCRRPSTAADHARRYQPAVARISRRRRSPGDEAEPLCRSIRR